MILQIALLAWLLLCTMAIHTGLSTLLGTWAWPLALTFTAGGMLAAAAWRRRQPRFIELDTQGTNTLTIFAHNGACVADGPLAGCAWGGWLLVLAVKTGKRRRTVLVAADALTHAAFRELAVRGRMAGRRSSSP